MEERNSEWYEMLLNGQKKRGWNFSFVFMNLVWLCRDFNGAINNKYRTTKRFKWDEKENCSKRMQGQERD